MHEAKKQVHILFDNFIHTIYTVFQKSVECILTNSHTCKKCIDIFREKWQFSQFGSHDILRVNLPENQNGEKLKNYGLK